MSNIAEVVLAVNDLHKSLPHCNLPVAISDIRSAISASINTKIEIASPKNWVGESLYGMLLRYPGRAVVLVNPNKKLTYCYKRFVACKEMAHLLIDKENDHTTDPMALVEYFFMSTPPDRIDEAMKSERWAVHAALEILVPWGTRSTILEMVQADATNLDIAQKYMVPVRFIEYWRSKGYQDLMVKAWEDEDVQFKLAN